MKGHYIIVIAIGLVSLPTFAQEEASERTIHKNMERSAATLDKFSRKSERRTKKAERRFDRYERKIQKSYQYEKY